MMRVLSLCLAIESAVAGSVEFSTSDLAGGSPGLGNIKASWGTSLELGGHKTKLDTVYDMKANEGMLKEAKLSGAVDAVSYALTHNFVSGVQSLVLSTKQAGATLKATLTSKDQLKELSAVKAVEKATLAPSYILASKVAKLKASYPLGSSVSVKAELSASVDDLGSAAVDSLDVDYSTSVGDVDLTLTLKPMDKVAEVDLIEASTGVVATASVNLDGGAPKVSLKRSLDF